VFLVSFERTLEDRVTVCLEGHCQAIRKTASVLDAIELMTQKESGASIFTSLGRLVGIFTEREVFNDRI
jgi:predicted transcriptional regulator